MPFFLTPVFTWIDGAVTGHLAGQQPLGGNSTTSLTRPAAFFAQALAKRHVVAVALAAEVAADVEQGWTIQILPARLARRCRPDRALARTRTLASTTRCPLCRQDPAAPATLSAAQTRSPGGTAGTVKVFSMTTPDWRKPSLHLARHFQWSARQRHCLLGVSIFAKQSFVFGERLGCSRAPGAIWRASSASVTIGKSAYSTSIKSMSGFSDRFRPPPQPRRFFHRDRGVPRRRQKQRHVTRRSFCRSWRRRDPAPETMARTPGSASALAAAIFVFGHGRSDCAKLWPKSMSGNTTSMA